MGNAHPLSVPPSQDTLRLLVDAGNATAPRHKADQQTTMAAKQTTLVSPLKRLLEKGKVKKKKKVPQHPGQGTTILSILLLVVKPNPNKEQDWNEMAKEDDGKSNILFFFFLFKTK